MQIAEIVSQSSADRELTTSGRSGVRVEPEMARLLRIVQSPVPLSLCSPLRGSAHTALRMWVPSPVSVDESMHCCAVGRWRSEACGAGRAKKERQTAVSQ